MFKQHLIRRSLVGGLVAASVAFPSAAQAFYNASPGGGPVAVTGPPPAASSAPTATSAAGFQWGDAGIGAAGAVVLLGGTAVGAGLSRRRRIQRRVAG
jgi:hypothetical protein